MDFITFVLGWIVGGAIGYGVFYFRYEDKKSIDWLRWSLDHTHHENTRLSAETKELSDQNLILKEKVTDLLTKNNDLSTIVGELNRYYYYLKEWYNKANELVTMLKWVDPVMEEKIKKIVWSIDTVPSPSMSVAPSKHNKQIPISDKPAWMPDLKKKR